MQSAYNKPIDLDVQRRLRELRKRCGAIPDENDQPVGLGECKNEECDGVFIPPLKGPTKISYMKPMLFFYFVYFIFALFVAYNKWEEFVESFIYWLPLLICQAPLMLLIAKNAEHYTFD